LTTERTDEAELVRDTLNGLVAFVAPGPDSYSVAQGESSLRPGGIAVGATETLIGLIDALAPITAPGNSAAVASVPNAVAEQVGPGASRGGFRSHFARLSFDRKAEMLRRLDGDPAPPVRYLAAFAPALAALISYAEYGALSGRRLLRRPVGWNLSRYEGVADGRAELLGYYRGRRRATGDRGRTCSPSVRPTTRTCRWR
jgi:hypothetical protein